ncbi:MAG: peptidoglycan recognition family protein [Planctomycetota bacterium]
MPKPAPISRSRIVWTSLATAMTLCTGLLLALDSRSGPSLDGVVIPLVAPSVGPQSVEVVFDTREPLDRERWVSIVIDHTGTRFATAESLDADHRAGNRRGLGYHFVIGNGRGLDDGMLHVGYRWRDQLPGAHTAGPGGEFHNRRSIGICLVGDGDRRRFSDRQVDRLVELVEALCRELEISPDQVLLHRDVAEVRGPGLLFPEMALRERLAALR